MHWEWNGSYKGGQTDPFRATESQYGDEEQDEANKGRHIFHLGVARPPEDGTQTDSAREAYSDFKCGFHSDSSYQFNLENCRAVTEAGAKS